MLNTERKQRIVDLVEEAGSLTVAELSTALGVSAATVRRDLVDLDERALIVRGHGGAARRPASAAFVSEPPLLHRTTLEAEAKQRIGKAAAELVSDGDTIIITGGTTTLTMVPYLAERRDLTVITNALNIVLELARYPQIDVIVLGGSLRHSEMSTVGPLGEEMLGNLHANSLFMGSSAIHPTFGLSADDVAEARSDRLFLDAVSRVVVLADHTKFGRVATVKIAPLSRIDRLITDGRLAADMHRSLAEHIPDIDFA